MEYPQYRPSDADNLPLTDDELNGLDQLLTALPDDSAMNIEALDGYLTALLLSPRDISTLPGAAWLPLIWGGDLDADDAPAANGNAPFASGKQKKRAVLLALRHLHAIQSQLRTKPEGWEPIFSVAENGEQDLIDAEDWCIGFLSAVDQSPVDWAPLFDDAEVGLLLEPIAQLGGDESQLSEEEQAELADPAVRDALSRSVAEAVPELFKRRYPS